MKWNHGTKVLILSWRVDGDTERGGASGICKMSSIVPSAFGLRELSDGTSEK